MALLGIGRTTAGSIVSSAFNAPEPILDGNFKRVLARLLAHPHPPARDTALFWRWSESLLDQQRPRDFNQALMDLGATVCTPRQPACAACPWRDSALLTLLAMPLARDRDPKTAAPSGDRSGCRPECSRRGVD